VQSPAFIDASVNPLSSEDARGCRPGELTFAVEDEETFEQEVEGRLFNEDWLASNVPGVQELVQVAGGIPEKE